jgi:sulfide:quinone oxidoreductase
MSSPKANSERFKVVVAGCGVAGLEAAMTLRELGKDAVDLTLIAPGSEFVYRPMTVREPFAQGAARRYPLKGIARDLAAELVEGELAWVEPALRAAHISNGEQHTYDALLLALGARAQPAYDHALTVDDRRMDATLHGLIQDIEGHYVDSVAFVIPARVGWPLPIYELALLTAGRAYDMNLDLSVSIVTPEPKPLAIFGEMASNAVADLLSQTRITTLTSSYAQVPAPGQVVLNPGGRRLRCDRIVALPELFGPAVRGLPAARHGFIEVDAHGRVHGVERVFAAGDATDFAVKHGGVAAQQADAAGEAIVALAGVAIEPKKFAPEIHGMLLTAGRPKYLTAQLTGGHGFTSSITDTPTWSPPAKIAAKRLAPYLEQYDRESRGAWALAS